MWIPWDVAMVERGVCVWGGGGGGVNASVCGLEMRLHPCQFVNK